MFWLGFSGFRLCCGGVLLDCLLGFGADLVCVCVLGGRRVGCLGVFFVVFLL